MFKIYTSDKMSKFGEVVPLRNFSHIL